MFGDDGIGDMFRKADERAEQMAEEFKRLAVDPCSEIPEVGDKAIVALGLLGMGHLWMREEAEVLEVASTSYHVRIRGRSGTHWIHQALVTDVIRAKAHADK